MNDDSRRILDTCITMDQFGVDNAADFPGGTPGGDQFAVLSGIANSFQATAGSQMAAIGESAQQFEVKSTNRETMRGQMSAISLISRSMEYAFDGISNKFRMPRNRNDAELLAAARAFVTEAAAYKAEFISYGLSGTFITDLTAAADAFEASLAATASASASRVEATADIEDWVTQVMRARRILDGIVKIKYADDIGKLAAWLSASHIEKAPKKKPPTP